MTSFARSVYTDTDALPLAFPTVWQSRMDILCDERGSCNRRSIGHPDAAFDPLVLIQREVHAVP